MPRQKKGGRPRTGSLYWTKSGWRARITIDVDGVPVQKTVNLETTDKVVARAKLRRLLKSAPSAATVEREAARENTFEEIARESTPKGDRLSRFETYVFPHIGSKPPSEIKARDVRALLEEARDAGKSRQTLIHIKGDVSSILGQLWRDELLPENVCKRVEVPEALPEVAELSGRERQVLTDEELFRYLSWQHPDERFAMAVLERQVMAILARTFGGLRTGDEHALTWDMLDVTDGVFAWGYAPRRKTRKRGGKPQKLEIPEMTRPILADWWERHGKPTSGPVFPVRRGARAGEHREGGSHASAFRRDLRRAFGIDTLQPVESTRSNGRKLTRQAWRPARELTPRELALLEPTPTTLPVDWHSWRRAYSQALADADVNAQQAKALAGHSTLAAHERYLRNAEKMRVMPAAALPKLLVTGPQRFLHAPCKNDEAEIENEGSGWQDLNLQQPAPKALAKGSSSQDSSGPDCAADENHAATPRPCRNSVQKLGGVAGKDTAYRRLLEQASAELGEVFA